MGLSSSQARLLHLTGRMHQIEYKAQKLEAQKLQMANESARVYEEYEDALDATKIQHKLLNTDGSVTFHDSTIDDLYFGAAGNRFGLFSTKDGHMYIPQDIANEYENNKYSASDFATAMTGYTPPVVPTISGDLSNPYTPASETVAKGQDIAMTRGQSKNTSVNSAITLTLNDRIGSSTPYNYSIQSTDGSDTNATFQYLKNGRLVISGDNLKITANGGQADDIILIGNNNVLDTGDGNDIVRLGTAMDSQTISGATTGNTVYTGSGNDHITVRTNGNKIVDSDSGTTVWFATQSVEGQTDTSGLSNPQKTYNYGDAGKNSTSGVLGTEGYAVQGNTNDCRLFSLINSLGKNSNHGDLSNYVTITQSGDTYNVKFKNYTGANNNVNISKSEAESYKGASGDITTVLIDMAINKLMYMNQDDSDLQSGATNQSNAFGRAQYQTVSKYFFGNENFGAYIDGVNGCDRTESLNKFTEIWNDYNNGTNGVTNMLVSFGSQNDNLGIVSGHAFSVKTVSPNNYVELVNPWDDADVLRLDWNTFTQYYHGVYTFGSPKYNENMVLRNVNQKNELLGNQKSYTLVNNAGTGNSDWDYYYNMHQQITNAGGYEVIPENMRTSTTYLTNIINSGTVYMKEFDKVNSAFCDTSVSTNTKLR